MPDVCQNAINPCLLLQWFLGILKKKSLKLTDLANITSITSPSYHHPASDADGTKAVV